MLNQFVEFLITAKKCPPVHWFYDRLGILPYLGAEAPGGALRWSTEWSNVVQGVRAYGYAVISPWIDRLGNPASGCFGVGRRSTEGRCSCFIAHRGAVALPRGVEISSRAALTGGDCTGYS